MAKSTCVKRGGTQFEIVEAVPHNSNFRLTFVQCRSCGGVVGVIDSINIGNERK